MAQATETVEGYRFQTRRQYFYSMIANVLHIAQLVRIHNVVFFLFTWLIIPCFVLKFQIFSQPYWHWFIAEYLLIGVAIGSIMAGAYAINDYYDLPTDAVNRPKSIILGKYFPKKVGLMTHWIASTIGGCCMAAWIWNSHAVNWTLLISITAMIIVLVWYSTYLKSIAVVGNLVIALAIALTFFLVAFTLPDSLLPLQKQQLYAILLYLGMCAFWLNWLREWAKDMEDREGDKIANRKTLPIIRSWKTNQIFGIILNIVYCLILCLMYFVLRNYINIKFIIFVCILSIAPIVYIAILISKAKQPQDFKLIVFLYKLIMLNGIISVLLMDFE